MKVFHLINTLSAGGAELHLLTLSRHLVTAGARVVVGCLREHVKGSRSLRSDFEAAGVEVIPFRGERRFDARFFPALMRTVSSITPDIVHSHLPRADLAAVFVCRGQRAPIWISTAHDVYSRSWSGRWALPLVGAAWRRADAVIAISGGVRDWLVAERGVPADRITLIRYGIDPGQFGRPATDLRASWQITGRPVIGSIGRLEPRKGHDVLIRAMPGVLRVIPNALLLIAGHDPWEYGGTLRALIRSLGLHSQVRLVGFQADVASFLHAIDLFAFATRSEGFGQVLVEAMDAGRPVVASRIAPLTEIVEDQGSGILVEPDTPAAFAAAIARLLTNPGEALTMGARGRDLVRERFSAARMAADTLSLYERVLARRRGR